MHAWDNVDDLTVCAALHAASGAPTVPAKSAPSRHLCGACHREVLSVPATDVLSKNFASWDAIRADGPARWLCNACAWVYKTRPGLRYPLMITRDPAATQPTYTQLRQILSSPIPTTMSLIVPVSGNRTITPLAQWGRLTHDGGTILWTRRHANLLGIATELRVLGAWERSLLDPSPPWKVLEALPVDQHERVRSLWRDFTEARHNETLGALMLRLSRKDPS